MQINKPEIDRFADKFCFDMILSAVANFVRNNYTQLEARSRIVQEPESASLDDCQIEFTTNVQTYDKLMGFDAIVSADIEVCEIVRGYDKSDIVTQWFRVSCQVIFEETIINQRISDGKGGGIEIYSSVAKNKTPLAATNNLVPIIRSDNYDKEAAKFLEKYCPEALKEPMPLPLDKIIATLNLPPIYYSNHLSPDFSVFGKICFSDEEFIAYDEQSRIVLANSKPSMPDIIISEIIKSNLEVKSRSYASLGFLQPDV